jgi:hypothetical protein
MILMDAHKLIAKENMAQLFKQAYEYAENLIENGVPVEEIGFTRCGLSILTMIDMGLGPDGKKKLPSNVTDLGEFKQRKALQKNQISPDPLGA